MFFYAAAFPILFEAASNIQYLFGVPLRQYNKIRITTEFDGPVDNTGLSADKKAFNFIGLESRKDFEDRVRGQDALQGINTIAKVWLFLTTFHQGSDEATLLSHLQG